LSEIHILRIESCEETVTKQTQSFLTLVRVFVVGVFVFSIAILLVDWGGGKTYLEIFIVRETNLPIVSENFLLGRNFILQDCIKLVRLQERFDTPIDGLIARIAWDWEETTVDVGTCDSVGPFKLELLNAGEESG